MVLTELPSSLDGVLVLLQQCRGDDGAPSFHACAMVVLTSNAEDTFVREWAVWAVRNMCETNVEAQDRIRRAFPSSAMLVRVGLSANQAQRARNKGRACNALKAQRMAQTQIAATLMPPRSCLMHAHASPSDSLVPDSCPRSLSQYGQEK